MYFQGPSMPHLYLYPWKLCLVKFELDIHVFDVENLFWFAVSLKKWLTHFFLKRMTGEIKNFNTQKNDISFHIFWLDFGFKCIVVNRTLHGGSLEIALTSPLIIFFILFLFVLLDHSTGPRRRDTRRKRNQRESFYSGSLSGN